MGAARRHAINAGGSFSRDARIAAHPLGATTAIPEAGGLEAKFPTSRARTDVAGAKPGDLRLARQTPRRSRHRVAEENGLVSSVLAVNCRRGTRPGSAPWESAAACWAWGPTLAN